jgi:phosphoglycolate phosphatase
MNVILFDLDGTLLDSTEAILEGFSVAYESFGKDSPSKQSVLSLIGHPLDFMFAHLGVAQDEVDAYVDAYKLLTPEYSVSRAGADPVR